MSSDAQQTLTAHAAAEEILRRIYGDDFTGCTIGIDSVATIVRAALKKAAEDDAQILELYEKAVEALHLISTPPGGDLTPTPDQLRTLLSDRLDRVNVLTKRLIDTIAAIKSQGSAE